MFCSFFSDGGGEGGGGVAWGRSSIAKHNIPTVFREHAILVRSLGVSQLVVAVNKLDTVDWSQQRFTDIREKLRLFLTKQVHLPFHHLCS